MSVEKKIFIIDMDDVITTSKGFISEMEKFLGKKIDISKHTSFYLQELLGDRKKEFFDNFDKINIYENAELMPNCYDVMKKLYDSGKYDLRICTAYIWPEAVAYAGSNLKNKYEFLLKTIDFLPPKNYIFTDDKSIIYGDIKMDDRIQNLRGASKKFLFDAYHNRGYEDDFLSEQGIIRIYDWKTLEDILL